MVDAVAAIRTAGRGDDGRGMVRRLQVLAGHDEEHPASVTSAGLTCTSRGS
jgi:hypothetical protein